MQSSLEQAQPPENQDSMFRGNLLPPDNLLRLSIIMLYLQAIGALKRQQASGQSSSSHMWTAY